MQVPQPQECPTPAGYVCAFARPELQLYLQVLFLWGSHAWFFEGDALPFLHKAVSVGSMHRSCDSTKCSF